MNNIYKTVTIILFLFIAAGVVFLGYINQNMLQEHKLLSEKYEEKIKNAEERIGEEMAPIKQTVIALRGELENLNQRQMESEQKLFGKIDKTDSNITNLNIVYENILNEGKKRRIESLYTDKYLAEKMREAIYLFKAGKINQAYTIYEIVSTEQPENQEARFYMYYTLFLKNKYDRAEYPKIKNGFNMLEKEGYIRKEMAEVLSYIEEEEKSISIEAR